MGGGRTIAALGALMLLAGFLFDGHLAAAARLITGREIKKGTLQASHLSPKARKALAGRRGASGLPGGGSVMSIGNSLMAEGHPLDGAAEPAHATGSSILGWSVLLSGGKLWLTAPEGEDAAAATSNLTAREIVRTHLPEILAHRPSIVLVGPLFTNGGPDRPALVEVVDGIRGYGGTPVLLTEFPSGGGRSDASTSREYVSRENVWIKRFAARRGVPVVDAYAVLVDPATNGRFKAGLSDDGLHQNAAGSRAVGQAVADVLGPLLAATPGAPLAQSGEAGLLTNANPLNLAGAGDGVLPAGWRETNGAGRPDSDEPAPAGNWLSIASGADGYNVSGADPLEIGPGDRMFLSFRVKVRPGGPGAIGKVVLRQGSAVRAGVSVAEELPSGVYAGEWTHAAGDGDNRFLLQAFGAGTQVSVAQITLINLTTGRLLSP